MKVFLSSTAQDLVEHRQAADDTLLRLTQQSVIMERFGPLPGQPVEECERLARECDVLVCIVAHRYGFVPEPGRGSITRREVEAALEAGRDVYAWIVDDSHPWTHAREQDRLTDSCVQQDPAQILEVAERVRALGEFKAWLRRRVVPDTFTTPDDLGRRLAIAFANRRATQQPSACRRAAGAGEIRVVHALQPAPHFHGREALVGELTEWVGDLASPDRVWSVVAAGGTGKTAVVERIVRGLTPNAASTLVWSFYEEPDAGAFLRACAHLFLREDNGPPGGRLERLERGLRDGRPHLVVLDGLERVQEEAGNGRVRGELSDHTLKLLLRAITAGLGRTRALVTSRFPLTDVADWAGRGYRETRLDDLTSDEAVAVLRAWGVAGGDAALRAAAEQVGRHALSVAVLGSYLRSFADGDIRAVAQFQLATVTGDDARAAKLARVLAFYAERLPREERELLARLSVFPRGITLELIGLVLDAGCDVAGTLVDARPRLTAVLRSLRQRGLVFAYGSASEVTWTAHPFLRDSFRRLLGCPAERVFAAVADGLQAGLDARPENRSDDPAFLDRYEHLIEATRLAGREERAVELFHGLDFYHLWGELGEITRAHRMLAAFSPTWSPEDLPASMPPHTRRQVATGWMLLAYGLGRLSEAWSVYRAYDESFRLAEEPGVYARWLQNVSVIAIARGRLPEARAIAEASLHQAGRTNDPKRLQRHRLWQGIVAHYLGDLGAFREHSAAAGDASATVFSIETIHLCRHHVDVGELSAASAICVAQAERRLKRSVGYFHALAARVALAEGRSPAEHLDHVRAWTARSGEMDLVIESRLLAARQLLAAGDLQAALDEANSGLLHAAACGYELLRIELLVALARIRLAWPDPPLAIQSAREALDAASHPEVQYAWGEADAAQVWGEAYVATREPELAARAFERALAVRRRTEHPGAVETERWLARLSASA
jgi:tetratricopeptide (TPR) repeat protein